MYPDAMRPTNPVFSDLCKAYCSGDLIVFAGAGISAAAGLPTWNHLTRELVSRLRSVTSANFVEEAEEYLGKGQLIDALSTVQLAMGPQEFGLAIEDALNDQGRNVPDVARAIATLAPKLRAVITTNLDHFLERAFRGDWPPITRAPADLASRRRYILKLHGTLLERNTWVFLRDQYDRAMFGASLEARIFRTVFSAYPVLFVGCGLADTDLDSVFAEVRAIAGEQPSPHFALVPHPVQAFRRRQLEAAGIRIIDYQNADGTHQELLATLHELATATSRGTGSDVHHRPPSVPPPKAEPAAANLEKPRPKPHFSKLPGTIELLAALPEREAQQFQGEYESLLRSRQIEGPMICRHAWRCAEILARHVHRSNRKTSRSEESSGEAFEQVVEELLAKNHISDALAEYLRALQHLGQADWNGSNPQSLRNAAQKCRKAIEQVIHWFVSIEPMVAAHDYLLSETYVEPELQVTEADIMQTVDIDNQVFAKAPDTPLPDYDRVLRWYRRNPSVYILLKNKRSRQVVGYINAMPVFDQTFLNICRGTVDIAELEHNIRRYDIPDFYRVYICSIGILEEYRTSHFHLKRLLDAFFLRLYRLAQKKIYVLEVVTDAATGEGEQMCISFGMRTTGRTTYNFPIYRTRMLPPQFTVLTDHAESVREHYQQVYARLCKDVEQRYSGVSRDTNSALTRSDSDA